MRYISIYVYICDLIYRKSEEVSKSFVFEKLLISYTPTLNALAVMSRQKPLREMKPRGDSDSDQD